VRTDAGTLEETTLTDDDLGDGLRSAAPDHCGVLQLAGHLLVETRCRVRAVP
jgi:hypothetical protein